MKQGALPIFQGHYQYFRNAELQPINEPWAIYRDSKQQVSIHSERRVNTNDHVLSVCATAQLAPLEDAELLQIPHYDLSKIILEYSSLSSEYKAIYWSISGGYRIEREINSKRLEVEELATDALLFPLLRIFTGPVVRKLAQAKCDKTVCTPDIRTLSNPSTVFQAVLTQRRASFKRRAEHKQHTADQFDYSGGEYPPGTLFWLDERDVLLGYEWQASAEECWRVELVGDRHSCELVGDRHS